jgi:hypothetical protein
MRPDVVRLRPANPARPPQLHDYPSHRLRVILPTRIAANRRLDYVGSSVTFPEKCNPAPKLGDQNHLRRCRLRD